MNLTPTALHIGLPCQSYSTYQELLIDKVTFRRTLAIAPLCSTSPQSLLLILGASTSELLAFHVLGGAAVVYVTYKL